MNQPRKTDFTPFAPHAPDVCGRGKVADGQSPRLNSIVGVFKQVLNNLGKNYTVRGRAVFDLTPFHGGIHA